MLGSIFFYRISRIGTQFKYVKLVFVLDGLIRDIINFYVIFELNYNH